MKSESKTTRWWRKIFPKKELPVIRQGEKFVFATDDGNPFHGPHKVTIEEVRQGWVRYDLGTREISDFLSLYRRIEQ